MTGWRSLKIRAERVRKMIEVKKYINEPINHPDRYAGGQYECIDVMVDVFGVQAVKDFCKLNAFKYLWREEKKGGIEDAKKAIWYLEKFIELGEKNDIKRSD